MLTRMNLTTRVLLAGWLLLLMGPGTSAAQPASSTEIQRLVQAFKADPRGPYQGIRWFCPDGTVRPAQSPCPEPGGIQHALLRDDVQNLARTHGIYLGQILAGTPNKAFLDASNHNVRLKQYQIERYLQSVDNGWIVRKARYYRGAVQAEDEDAWGKVFLTEMLSENERLNTQFFLMRQACRDIPHSAGDNRLRNIRGLAKTLGDSLTNFQNLRIKIHGQPDATDLDSVKTFRARNLFSATVDSLFNDLEANLTAVYLTPDNHRLVSLVQRLPARSIITDRTRDAIEILNRQDPARACISLSELMWDIRLLLPETAPGPNRLALMDLSLELETVLMKTAATWHPSTSGSLLEKAYGLAKASAACGFLEIWEWKALEPELAGQATGIVPLETLLRRTSVARRAVNWGAATVRVVYETTAHLFSPFEPLAAGFIDDRIRSSILLNLGSTSGQLADLSARLSGLSNQVIGLEDQAQILGLNPGFAVGELEVITGPPEDVDFHPDRIYLLQRAPAEMKPVAGIATVSEGNTVSHVQLLARNLGIPNAVLSPQTLNALLPYSGQRFFYAVSPRGAVVLKPASEMTTEEAALVEVRTRREEMVTVPTDRIDLSVARLLPLIDLNATDSGRLCGPKAANLGQLRTLFPNRVAPGLVIPFGIFRQHLDQPMPGTGVSFWEFLQDTFENAEMARHQNTPSTEIDRRVLGRLSQLREAIQKIPFLPEFGETLERSFLDVFEAPFGNVPIFVRSDTNMEDLKEFTGAGLNLTVPNVLEREQVLQAIRNVWASPYTERSYRWRQKYLLNPENVYPSILLLRSVNVEKSGVLITTGVTSGNSADLTAAFNRGVGGAVEGQAAESYLLQAEGNDILLSPSREPVYTSLPPSGGVRKIHTTFEHSVLNWAERSALRRQAIEIRARLPGTPGIESNGPFDVELGFLDGEIWLFQVRPFVENRRARSSTYLQSLDPELPEDAEVNLKEELKP